MAHLAHWQRFRYSLLALTLITASASHAGHVFEKRTVDIGTPERQTVVPGFFLGDDRATIAVLHVNADEQRILDLHVIGDSSITHRTILSRDVTFVDVLTDSTLIMYAGDGLWQYDPSSSSLVPFFEVNSSFDPPRHGEIPWVDVTHDVNGDGMTDIVVPDSDGFNIMVQQQDGSFDSPIKVGTAPDLSAIYGADGYRFDPWEHSRIHQMDYNHDDRIDLVYWDGDHFRVVLQNQGRYATGALSFETDVLFQSDKLDDLAQGNWTGRVLKTIDDLNADGTGDLVIYRIEGKSPGNRQSAYEVHFGRRTETGTVFESAPGLTFKSDGHVQLDLDRHDFDGDGRDDVMITTLSADYLKRSLWKNLKGMMGDDVWLDLAFYRMTESSTFRNEPDKTLRIAFDGIPSNREPGWVPLHEALQGATHTLRKTETLWPRAFNLVLRVADLTGDGRADLLLGKNTPDGVDVFLGQNSNQLLEWSGDLSAESSANTHVGAPNDQEYVQLTDLNRDGKQDILIHHPFNEKDGHGLPLHAPGTEPQRVVLLIAR